MPVLPPLFQLRRRDYLVALALITLAFALRCTVLLDRAGHDPAWIPPEGSDQLTYIRFAGYYEEGTWPNAPFRYQPGFVYFLVGARALVGDSLAEMRLTVCALSAVATGVIVGAGWLLTRRRWGGYAAGALYAVYPVAIFYSTELLVEGVAILYVIVILFLALWQRERLAVWRSLLIGVLLGLCTITRTNLALLALACAAWIWLAARERGLGWRSAALHIGLIALAMAGGIAPVTLYNRQMGSSQLITEVGSEEIYRANSRDSDGTYMIGPPAFATADRGYEQAQLVDIRLRPLRFLELQLRKVGLYFSDSEPANNIDYYQNGEAISPLLGALGLLLDFRILSIFGLLGLAALWWTDRRAFIFFALLDALIVAGVMIIWVVSRVRLPATIPLILTAASLVALLPDFTRESQRWIRRLLPAALIVAGFLLFCAWALDHLPQPATVAALPSDAVPAHLVFDNAVELVGYRPLESWPATRQNWGYPYDSIAVELFWQAVAPTPDDYEFSLALLVDDTRITARDRAIGTISYPPWPTTRWQPGTIYAEIVGLRIPPDAPLDTAGELRLSVYRTDGEQTDPDRAIYPASLPDGATSARLLPFAVYLPDQPVILPADLTPVDIRFGDGSGDLIALRGVRWPAEAAPGEAVSIDLSWLALHDVPGDETVFVHLLDANGAFITGYDAPAGSGRGAGALTPAVWMPGYVVEDQATLTMPAAPGTYTLTFGLYDPVTLERLATNAPDNVVTLGNIQVSQ